MKGLVSVIVSTYNKPDYLALTLRSLRAQTDRDFEVIVADDGSDERTKCVVKCEEKFSDLTTKHVWHPKQGFRLAAIRNRAVEAASGQYLIFMDGDCLAPPDFVATHRRLAEAGWHVIGQRVLLSRSFTHRILQKFSDDQDEIPFIKWNLAYFALHYCGRSVNRLLPFVKLALVQAMCFIFGMNPTTIRSMGSGKKRSFRSVFSLVLSCQNAACRHSRETSCALVDCRSLRRSESSPQLVCAA